MKKYIYAAIAVVCGALNANMMCLPSHNMVTDVIGVFALFGGSYIRDIIHLCSRGRSL